MELYENEMVSILCFTYNHLNYIRDAIDGFLSQKTSFKYKIVIYDDASTDGTSDVILEYAKLNPGKIDVFVSERNRFRDMDRQDYLLKFQRDRLKGRYVAICEGDDCWIDSYKLQRQVDYMEAHPTCSLHMHKAVRFNDTTKRFSVQDTYETGADGTVMQPKEIIIQPNGHPPTASFLFRREILFCDDFFFKAPVGDYTLLLAALTKGYIYSDSHVMSVYRWMTQGSYTVKLQQEQVLSTYFNIGLIIFLKKYDYYTNYIYKDFVKDRINSFALTFVMGMEEDCTVQEAIRNCFDEGYNLGDIDEQILEHLECLRRNCIEMSFISSELRQFIDRYERIWIMGAGKYAGFMADKLKNGNIEFEGFAVTDVKDNPNNYRNKKVIGLNNIPNKESVGVIVAILPWNRGDLEISIHNAEIHNYYYPFDVNLF